MKKRNEIQVAEKERIREETEREREERSFQLFETLNENIEN